MYGLLVPMDEYSNLVSFKVDSDIAFCVLESIVDIIYSKQVDIGVIFLVNDVEKFFVLVNDISKIPLYDFDYVYDKNYYDFHISFVKEYDNCILFYNDKQVHVDNEAIIIDIYSSCNNKYLYMYNFKNIKNKWYKGYKVENEYLKTLFSTYNEVNKDLLRKSIYEFISLLGHKREENKIFNIVL